MRQVIDVPKRDKILMEMIKQLDMSKTSLEEQTAFSEQPHKSHFDEVYELKEGDGFIEVRDHELFIINPKAGGSQPFLKSMPNVLVYVNDILITEEQLVFENDIVKWDVVQEPPFEISINDDEMFVYLKLNHSLYHQYRLKNKKRALYFTIEIEALPKKINIEEISSLVVEDLLKKGVEVEHDLTAIIQELTEPTFKKVVIAEGLPVIPSRDAKLEVFFESTPKVSFEEINGKINFKEKLKIPSVEKGGQIAQYYPPSEGKNGYTVFGTTIAPKPAKNIEVRAKSRVKITEDGKCFALQSGRPSLSGKSVKYLDVLESYEVNGDVDINTGNIYFTGDVIIKGHVKDGMHVECSGSIYVYGNVYQSQLTALQNIFIAGTVINSSIFAGQQSMLFGRVYKIVQDLLMSFKNLQRAINQLEQTLKSNQVNFDFNYMLFTLIEAKFSDIVKNVAEIYEIFTVQFDRRANLPLQFRIMVNALSSFKDFHSIKRIMSIEPINSIQHTLQELIAQIESMVLQESCIELKSANLSTLKTNGDIVIKGDGVVQTNFFAGGNITFDRLDSVIRGGNLEALKSIKAGVVGTESGRAPVLYAGESIDLYKIYQANIKFPGKFLLIDQLKEKLQLVYDPKTMKIAANKDLNRLVHSV